MDAHVVVADPARTCRFGDLAFTTVLGSAFGGSLSIFEARLAPGCLSGPLHVHEREDAVTYVLDGSLTFQVGEAVVVAPAGSAVVEPRGVPHTFWNAGARPARALDVATPGGLERLYEDLAAMAAGDPDAIQRIESMEQRYGVVMDWDSIPALVAEHHVRFAAA